MFSTLLKNIRKSEAGATAIEYGLIAALIAIAAIGGLSTVSDSLDTTFSTVSSELDTASESTE